MPTAQKPALLTLPRIYKGALIERTTTGGFRWISFIPGHGTLRADTLNGIRRLISAARNS